MDDKLEDNYGMLTKNEEISFCFKTIHIAPI